MREAFFRPLFFVSAAALVGCFTQTDNRTAGVDDFPNSVYASVSGFLGQTQQTGALQTIPADAQSFLGSPAAAKTAALAKSASSRAALAKVADGSGSWVVAFDSTILDPIQNDTLGITHDTLYGVGPAPFQGTVYRAKIVAVYRSGELDSIVTADADGDSNIAAVAGRVCKNRVSVTAIDSGIAQQAELVQGPGPDNDFNTQNDNVYYAAQWWKIQGADTLASAVYSSADSDSIVIDNAATSVVYLDYRAWNPPENPGVTLSTTRLKESVRYQSSATVLEVSGENQWQNGESETFGVFNAQGGVDLNLQDTVLARFTTFGAPGDTLDSSVTAARMNLGGTWDQKSDDSVYTLSVTVANRLGDTRRAVFAFTAASPMPAGTSPRDGTVALEFDYADATVLTLTGTLRAGALTADIVDRNGRHYHAVWDANGSLLSVSTP